MKKFQKILSLFLLITIFLFGIGLFNSPTVNAYDTQITKSGTLADNNYGQYRVIETKETNLLPYGVKHFRDIAESTISTVFNKQQVNVLEVPSTKGIKIVSWANLNDHKWTLTTVKNLIRDYEAKNPGWRVVGAINGDFFDIGAKGDLPFQTTGAVVSNGNFYKTSTNNIVGFPNDGSVNSLIADLKPTRSANMTLDIFDSEGQIIKSFKVDKNNVAPADNQTSVYYGTYKTHEYQPITVDSQGAASFFVEFAELALPNNANDFYGLGIISNTKDMTLQKGQFGIVTKNAEVEAALAVGTKVRVQYTYTGAAANIDSATGVGETFLRKNEYVKGSVPDTHPRTVIGRKADGTIVMAVIDGRQAANDMYGGNGADLAAMMRRYGAVEAYNLDGGGSSTMILRQGDELVVKNSPSDGNERSDSNCLLVTVKDPDIELANLDATEKTLDLTFDINDYAGHDVQKLMLNGNGTQYEVVDGKLSISNLRANTEFKYSLSYQDSNGKLIPLGIDNTVYTLKQAPTFKKVNVVDEGLTLKFTVDYIDRNTAGNFKNALMKINNKDYYFENGTLTVTKEEIGGEVTEIILYLVYDLNNNLIEHHEILNPQFKSTLALNIVIKNVNDFVNSIYG